MQVTLSARSQQTQRIYEAYLPTDAPILEAGCGLGSVAMVLRGKGFPVIGADYAPAALGIAQQYEPGLPLCAADVHALPHAANSLGAYLSFGVLEHFEQGMGPALAEAYRVLQPGGILVLTIPYPSVVHRLVNWKRRLQGASTLTHDDFYESTYTRQALIDNAQQTGFTVLKTVPTSHSFTLWTLGGPFRKPGYYETSDLAEWLGRVSKQVLPWALSFSTLLIGQKPA
jgi:SAM-dependent methyltransferase